SVLVCASGKQLLLTSKDSVCRAVANIHAAWLITSKTDNDDLGIENSQTWILSNGASRKCVSPAIQLNRPCAACLPPSRHRKHRPSRRELARPSSVSPESFLRYQGRS